MQVYQSKFVNMYYGPWKIPPAEKPPAAVKIVCVGENEKVIIAIHTSIALLHAGLTMLFARMSSVNIKAIVNTVEHGMFLSNSSGMRLSLSLFVCPALLPPPSQVVGIHCIGIAADEMLQGFGVALKVCFVVNLKRCNIPYSTVMTLVFKFQ